MWSFRERTRFDRVYDEFHSMVRNVTFNMIGNASEVDDLIQETFLKVWKSLPRFAHKSSVKTWVYRITMNACLDYLKRKAVSSRAIESLKSHPEETPADNDSVRDLIQSALMTLDAEHRGVVVLFYFEDLDIRSISRLLKLPEGTVKSRLHHAKKKIKDSLLQNRDRDSKPHAQVDDRRVLCR